MIKIAIWDRHPVTRAGLRGLISEHSDLQFASEASSEAAALTISVDQTLDVLLLDCASHEGLESLSAIHRAAPALSLLIFTGFPAQHGAIPALREGARGYLNKTAHPREIIEAIRTVSQGRRFFSQEVTQLLALRLGRGCENSPHEKLSERESQVFYQLARGHTAGNTAATLALSVKTVSTYRTRLLEKLGLSSNSDLTYYALNNRLMQ